MKETPLSIKKETFDKITKLQEEALKQGVEVWYISEDDDPKHVKICFRFMIDDKPINAVVKFMEKGDRATTYTDTLNWMESFKDTVVKVSNILEKIQLT